jgi:hypothetical protein
VIYSNRHKVDPFLHLHRASIAKGFQNRNFIQTKLTLNELKEGFGKMPPDLRHKAARSLKESAPLPVEMEMNTEMDDGEWSVVSGKRRPQP